MKYLVTGVYCGLKKDGSGNFYKLHLVDVDYSQAGLTGYRVSNAYCSEDVARNLKVNCIYELTSPIGYNSVTGAVFVKDNGK